MHNGQGLEAGAGKGWFRVKVESLGRCLWLNPERQEGRAQHIKPAACAFLDGVGGRAENTEQLKGL